MLADHFFVSVFIAFILPILRGIDNFQDMDYIQAEEFAKMSWVAGGTAPRRTRTHRDLLVLDPKTEELPVFRVDELALAADVAREDQPVARPIFSTHVVLDLRTGPDLESGPLPSAMRVTAKAPPVTAGPFDF